MRQVLCPVIVGRDAEIATLEVALEGARSGRGKIILVSGEAGIGKSRLVREVMERAHTQGLVVGGGRAIEAGSRIAFRPLGEALQGALRDHGPPMDPDLAQFRAVLAPFVPAWDSSEVAVAEPGLVLLEGLLRLSRSMAKDRGLLLVLEDLQWADSDTLDAIGYFADGIASEPIICLCTERSGMPGAASEALAGLVARRAVQKVQLNPLPDDTVEAMARLSLEVESVPPAVLGALRRRAEGVPFLIEEMLTAYLAAGGVPEASAEWSMSRLVADALPPSLQDLVRTRLDPLNADVREIVRAAAILGRTFEWDLLVRITQRDRDRVLEALRAAVAAHVLVGAGWSDPNAFAFRHALMREAVVADLLPPELSGLSLAAADAIERERPGVPGEWCERVAELREQGGDWLGAVRLLQESARRALARGALSTAEASLRRARQLGEHDYTLWVGTDELLIEVFARAGKVDDLAAVTGRFVAAIVEQQKPHAPRWTETMRFPPKRMAQLHLRAAQAGLPAGRFTFVRDHLGRARELAADDPETFARIGAMTAALAYEEGDFERALTEATGVLRAADGRGLKPLVCEALDVIGKAALGMGDLHVAMATFERLLGEGGDKRTGIWAIRALAELGAIQSLARGDARMLEQARMLAIEAGAVSALASIDLELARHHLARPRRAEADASLGRALEASRRFGLPLLPEVLIARAALLALGEHEKEMARSLEEARTSGPRPDIEAMALGEAEAVLALVREDRAGARKLLDRAAALPAQWRRGPPWFFGLRRLLHALEGTEPVPDTALAHPHPILDGYAGSAKAVAIGREGDTDAAAEEFARADSVMPQGWRRETARRLVAEAALAEGWGEPGAWAKDALAFFEGTGFTRLANACKRLMRGAGVAVPRAGRGSSKVPPSLQVLGVTSRETDVLMLVAEGLSNVEIAERLFLSPRTVETHVKSLMRKAETPTRVQLVVFAGRHVAAEGDPGE